MKYKPAKLALVMAILFYLASMVAIGTTTIQTGYAQSTGSTDTLTMTVKFHPATSGIAGFFTVDSITAKTTSASICPLGNCQVSMDNETTAYVSKSGAPYTMGANLKVSITKGDTIASKFYPIIVDVTPISSIEKAGKTTYLLNGTINFGQGVVNPEMIYRVKNGTLEVDSQHSRIMTLDSVLQNDTR
jgi:hypothetical protein